MELFGDVTGTQALRSLGIKVTPNAFDVVDSIQDAINRPNYSIELKEIFNRSNDDVLNFTENLLEPYKNINLTIELENRIFSIQEAMSLKHLKEHTKDVSKKLKAIINIYKISENFGSFTNESEEAKSIFSEKLRYGRYNLWNQRIWGNNCNSSVDCYIKLKSSFTRYLDTIKTVYTCESDKFNFDWNVFYDVKDTLLSKLNINRNLQKQEVLSVKEMNDSFTRSNKWSILIDSKNLVYMGDNGVTVYSNDNKKVSTCPSFYNILVASKPPTFFEIFKACGSQLYFWTKNTAYNKFSSTESYVTPTYTEVLSNLANKQMKGNASTLIVNNSQEKISSIIVNKSNGKEIPTILPLIADFCYQRLLLRQNIYLFKPKLEISHPTRSLFCTVLSSALARLYVPVSRKLKSSFSSFFSDILLSDSFNSTSRFKDRSEYLIYFLENENDEIDEKVISDTLRVADSLINKNRFHDALRLLKELCKKLNDSEIDHLKDTVISIENYLIKKQRQKYILSETLRSLSK